MSKIKRNLPDGFDITSEQDTGCYTAAELAEIEDGFKKFELAKFDTPELLRELAGRGWPETDRTPEDYADWDEVTDVY